MVKVGIAKSAPQNEFQNVIEAFNHAVADAIDEEIQDFISPFGQCRNKRVQECIV